MSSVKKTKGSEKAKKTKNIGKKAHEEDVEVLSGFDWVRKRPDNIIGSIYPVETEKYVFDGDTFTKKDITYTPGLFKIFDEIITNSVDHAERSKKGGKPMKHIKITIKQNKGEISVENDGVGIPVHEIEYQLSKNDPIQTLWRPEVIFSKPFSSTNYGEGEISIIGGKNGIGAKATVLFSKKFTVYTYDEGRGIEYTQTFKNGLINDDDDIEEPIIKKKAGKNGKTKITFIPDLKKFHQEKTVKGFTDGDYQVMVKRAYDIAGLLSKQKIKVYLDGTIIPIKSFSDYCALYLNDKQQIYYYSPNERWEVAFVRSPHEEYEQISFVNGVETPQGGTHVKYILDQVLTYINNIVKKKLKKDGRRGDIIKSKLIVFVKSVIENPEFNSQTKVLLTLPPNKFGSKMEFPESQLKKLDKTLNLSEDVIETVQLRDDAQLKKSDKIIIRRQLDIPKLDEATLVGKTKEPLTMIFTEGDSAKSLAIAGMSVVGKKLFGAFPLRGKLINPERSIAKAEGNAEFTYIKKILGLQIGKVYTEKNISDLRYRHVLIFADADPDGSHIKGLFINLIRTFWPSLLKIKGFLRTLRTPIVKITCQKDITSIYSKGQMVEFFKKNDENKCKIKYYKGLGTSTSQEGKEYFEEYDKLKTDYIIEDEKKDFEALSMAFDKDRADARKDFLREYDPEENLFDHSRDKISYHNFVWNEFRDFGQYDNSRSLPSLVDGFKPSLRKIFYTSYKLPEKKEIKVAQLAPKVSEDTSYHHGEASLMEAIIGMAQSYTGSNNINLLVPNGQFGTRLQGGKDHAQPRYIFTYLDDIAKKIFPKKDVPILHILEEEGQKIEPMLYYPIIPMILVNGTLGLGTGFSTYIPPYNPEDLIDIIRDKIHNKDVKKKYQTIKPWFRGFKGEILLEKVRKVGDKKQKRVIVKGKYEIIGKNKVKITELPMVSSRGITPWIEDYFNKLKEMKEGTKQKVVVSKKTKKDLDKEKKNKAKAFIKEVINHSTDVDINIEVEFTPSEFLAIEKEMKSWKGGGSTTISERSTVKNFSDPIEIRLGLVGTLSLDNMYLFDKDFKITLYDKIGTIIDEFYDIRKEMYIKRKKYLLEEYEKTLEKLSEKARFIKLIIEKSLKVNNILRKDIITSLEVKKFKKYEDNSGNFSGYHYLIGMPIYSLTKEEYQRLLAEKGKVEDELSILKKKTIEEIWEEELDELEDEYPKFIERINDLVDKKKGKKTGGKKK